MGGWDWSVGKGAWSGGWVVRLGWGHCRVERCRLGRLDFGSAAMRRCISLSIVPHYASSRTNRSNGSESSESISRESSNTRSNSRNGRHSRGSRTTKTYGSETVARQAAGKARASAGTAPTHAATAATASAAGERKVKF